ncbi:hypothetical protein [Leptospira mayottensis]|uniref:hypothetical protein n=1 Tax=Leptospira mayottensis TaxID=1137606 RepID=UPI000E35B671|nr:hypothetical protein [Leptospira mayottensis]AXR67831.1 hypothetical protein DPV73_07180 [Leptospira mayottensis]
MIEGGFRNKDEKYNFDYRAVSYQKFVFNKSNAIEEKMNTLIGLMPIWSHISDRTVEEMFAGLVLKSSAEIHRYNYTLSFVEVALAFGLLIFFLLLH